MFPRFQWFFESSLRQDEQLLLDVTETSVQLFSRHQEVWRFRWADVTKIVTYKRDLFAVDLVCLNFFVESRQLTFSTHEEIAGFRDLCDRMRCSFPSIGEAWSPEVAFPAFVPNEKVLYDELESSRHR